MGLGVSGTSVQWNLGLCLSVAWATRQMHQRYSDVDPMRCYTNGTMGSVGYLSTGTLDLSVGWAIGPMRHGIKGYQSYWMLD